MKRRQLIQLGASTGLAVAGFDLVVAEGLFERVLDLPLWAQAVLPGVGLLAALVLLRTLGHGASPSTADEYIKAFHDRDGVLDHTDGTLSRLIGRPTTPLVDTLRTL